LTLEGAAPQALVDVRRPSRSARFLMPDLTDDDVAEHPPRLAVELHQLHLFATSVATVLKPAGLENARGLISTMMLPILISVSVAPGSYFFCACAVVAISTAAEAKKVMANGRIAPCCGIIVSPPVKLV
jgi:hypothetical protein